MADFRAARGGDGSPSRVATNEQFRSRRGGKLTQMTDANPTSPVLVGKLCAPHPHSENNHDH